MNKIDARDTNGRPDPDEQLDADRRVERRLLWKGLASLVLVLVIVLVRQRYLV